jgi:hypothetical protein
MVIAAMMKFLQEAGRFLGRISPAANWHGK